MKCPVCLLEQKHYEGEKVHVCPYCDAILIYKENRYVRWEFEKWWISHKKHDSLGALETESMIFEFNFKEVWYLNNFYKLIKKDNERNVKNEEHVKWVEGIIPLLLLPGSSIKYEINENEIILQDKEESFIFKRI